MDGTTLEADRVVVACGARTGALVPWLNGPVLRATAQFVLHLEPPGHQGGMFTDHNGRFPAYCAAVKETGFYGFPLHPDTGACKVS